MLLPHEVLHAFAHSSKFLFDSVVLGQLDSEARIRFWAHVSELEPWKHHPIIRQERGSWEKLIGVCVHGDGAQMYKEDEFFVWSVSSVFGGSGLVKRSCDSLDALVTLSLVEVKFLSISQQLQTRCLQFPGLATCKFYVYSPKP